MQQEKNKSTILDDYKGRTAEKQLKQSNDIV